MTAIKAFKNQNYNSLDQEHSSTRLFIDTEFPACVNSISHTGKLDLKSPRGGSLLQYIEWRRPHEIIDEPHFVVDGFQRRDVGQGYLGDCWFLAAIGALSLDGELMAQVIPYDQVFEESGYTGMFHFRFWLFGEWNDVVIDDRLPCYKGNLIFCRNNKNSNEFWAPLLEKAYAKVCGSYEFMVGGFIADGLIDFTSGINECFSLHPATSVTNRKKVMKRILYQAMEKKSMVGCATNQPVDESDKPGFKNTGLMAGHAYSVTQMKDLTAPDGTVTLVRCLNPWGDHHEWKGDWSDNSELWDRVTAAEKRKFKFHALHDGEFWMSYDDFFTYFDDIEICHRSPEQLSVLESASSTTNKGKLVWHEELFHGGWKSGKSAGGSGLYGQPREKYWTNPQYLIKLNSPKNDTEEKSCTMIVALMLKDFRRRILNDQKSLYIAFDVYKVKADADLDTHVAKRQKFYMADLEYIGESDRVSLRSVSERFQVGPGAYVLIPNTLNYNESGKYLLRIFTEEEADQTATIKLKSNKINLADSDIKRPHIEDDSEPLDASDSSDEDTNTEVKTKEEDGKVDDKPVLNTASTNKQTQSGLKRTGGRFSSSNSTKPRS